MNTLFYFLHAILCHGHTIPLKQLSIADFPIVTKDGLFWLSIVMSPHLICDVTKSWGTGIVMPYFRWLFLHAQIGAKANFTVKIYFSPSGFHSLVYKKISAFKLPNLKFANLMFNYRKSLI